MNPLSVVNIWVSIGMSCDQCQVSIGHPKSTATSVNFTYLLMEKLRILVWFVPKITYDPSSDTLINPFGNK